MGIRTVIDQYTIEGEYVRTWPSMTQVCEDLGVYKSQLQDAVDSSSRTAAGFKWKKSVVQTLSFENRIKAKCLYTEVQRKEFDSRIREYMPVVWNLVKKYDFINRSNQDDYIQEALTFAWMQYYTYKDSEDKKDNQKHFGAWFKTVCSWGIFQFLKYNSGWRTREFDNNFDDQSDDQNENLALTFALYHCLEDLSDKDQAIINCWMTEKSSRQASNELMLSENMYNTGVSRIKDILRNKMSYYLFGIRNTKQRCKIRAEGRPSPVAKCDSAGNRIEVFPTIKSVKLAGYCPRNVQNALAKKTLTHKGYYWRYAKMEDVHKLKLETSIAV